MITLGFFTAIDNHPKVVFKPNLKSIDTTPAGSIVLTTFERNDLPLYETYAPVLGILVYSLLEFVQVAKCGVRYALAPYPLAKKLQKAADAYLYDTKVLALIDTEEMIEQAARDEIDGVAHTALIG
jgi:hypothetical protein